MTVVADGRWRQDALESYEILDTARERVFDDLVADAADLVATPWAGLHLFDADRVWAKAAHGYAGDEAGRGILPCELVVAGGTEVVLPDVTADPRFAGSPLVHGSAHLRAYAGVPLVSAEGVTVGTLCVMDTVRRPFTDRQLHLLRILGAHAVALLELRRHEIRSRGEGSDGPTGPRATPAEIGAALGRDEFRLVFQPVLDLATDRVTSAEALVRWNHPTLGTLGPAAFLPQMEATSLMLPLGRRLLQLAAEAALVFRRVDPDFGVAVNVSGQQLRRPGLAREVVETLERNGLPAGALLLELVETVSLDGSVAGRELGILHDAGVRVALDDFGVAYSSVTRLLDLPFTAVKIDRALVARATVDARAFDTMAAVTGACRSWGLSVIAEGVETLDEDRVARETGCTHAQGWLHGRPVAADALRAALEDAAG